MKASIQYPENTLCIMKRGTLSLKINHTDFKPYKPYRVSFDINRRGCCVFGEWMSLKDFEACFELYMPFLQEKLKALGLINNEIPVTLKEFKEAVSIHDYGQGRTKRKILYVGHSKENCFAFYPEIETTNPMVLKECYTYYTELVNGNFEMVDDGYVAWGNSGYPLVYAKIYYR